MSPLRVRHLGAVLSVWLLPSRTRVTGTWLAPSEVLQALELLLTSGSLSMTLPMDSTQKLIEKLVVRRIQNTGEYQAVATANVLTAFEKLRRNETQTK